MYIALAILAFGLIIVIHEVGHFLACRALNVKVNELAIGMGPKLLSKQGKETLYTLRLIPFGGYCSMEGEYGERLEKDDEKKAEAVVFADGIDVDNTIHEDHTHDEYKPKTVDPRAFTEQSRLRRVIICAAGSFANIVAALIIMIVLSLSAEAFVSTTLSEVIDNLPNEGPSEILPGDRLISINGERLYYFDDFMLFMNLNAGMPAIIEIKRGDEIIEYRTRTYTVGDEQVYRYSLSFAGIEPTFWESIKYGSYQTLNFIRMIRISIVMMVRGDASVTEVAGPVGIVDMMNTVAQESPSVLAAISNIIYFTAFIGVNVAVINMLPIPAMDGGRILFIFLSWGIEKITRRELDPKYENYINTGAFMLLIGLMVLIMYNDVMRLIG